MTPLTYQLTERGQGLDEALRALRRWGVGFLADPTADGAPRQHFDVTYVDGIETLADGRFQLVVDGRPSRLDFADGRLAMEPGSAPDAELTVRTSAAFLDRWAAGEADWDDGRARGEDTVDGAETSWPRWLAATGISSVQKSPSTARPSDRSCPMSEKPSDFFTAVSAPLLTQPGVEPGTMMGFPCLRVTGAFFASCDPRTGDLVVKLPRDRATELISTGRGKPFTPAGRTFREWVLVDDRDEVHWADLIDEALRFVSGRPASA